MTHQTFIKACELLKASGSSYEALITPFWSDEQDGVVLPLFGKVIPRLEPERNRCTWHEAMADAAAAGLSLPTMEELQYMHHHLDQINGLLLANNGNRLPRNTYFWACTEYSQSNAWIVLFGSGSTHTDGKCYDFYARPLAAFKKL